MQVHCSSEGEVLADVFTIANNAEGFDTFLQTIRSCTRPEDKIKVGLEATGHYSYNILGFLRYAIFNATKFVCNWDPTFADYLAKKRGEGKHYNVAISHAAKKLVRLTYAMEQTRQPTGEPLSKPCQAFLRAPSTTLCLSYRVCSLRFRTTTAKLGLGF